LQKRKLFVSLEPPESLGASCMARQSNVKPWTASANISRSGRRAAPCHDVLDDVRAGERTPQFRGSPSFVTVSIRRALPGLRRKRPPSPFRAPSEVAKKRLGLAGVVHLPGLPQCASHWRASISAGVQDVARLVYLAALNGRVASEGRADCLGESLRAVDDEEVRHSGIEPRSTRLPISACTVAAFSVAPSTTPSGCLSPFTSTPIAAPGHVLVM